MRVAFGWSAQQVARIKNVYPTKGMLRNYLAGSAATAHLAKDKIYVNTD
jgi:hypothetical protein